MRLAILLLAATPALAEPPRAAVITCATQARASNERLRTEATGTASEVWTALAVALSDGSTAAVEADIGLERLNRFKIFQDLGADRTAFAAERARLAAYCTRIAAEFPETADLTPATSLD